MAEELNNPIFEDEREFLERKKQEYERALLGEVEHIKEQGTQVGKVALVGAGLAGSVWLIAKVFGGGKRKRKSKKHKESRHSESAAAHENRDYSSQYDFDTDDDFELDDEAFLADRSAEFQDDESDSAPTGYYAPSASYQQGLGTRSARESAQAFMTQDDDQDQDYNQQPDPYDHNDDLDGYGQSQGVGNDDQDFDNGFGQDTDQDNDLPQGRLDFGPTVHQHRSGSQSESAFAYDDSRRLPKSNEFTSSQNPRTAQHDVDVAWPKTQRNGPSLGKRVGGMVMSFLGTSTGKAVAAQATAAVLAYVSKKINDKEPKVATAKNADLANAPATSSFYGSMPQPIDSSPAVSLTLTDAPTEHPAS